MRPLGQRASHSLLRDTRGATITEYALILFIVAVVGATSLRLFGGKLQSGMGKASNNLQAQDDNSPKGDSAAGEGGEARAGAGTTTHGGGGGGGGGGGFGGPRVATTAQEGTSYAKFALIALCIIGGGAAFFAMMKGKTAR